MTTRKDYMNGKVSHHDYHLEIARECGISYKNSKELPRIKRALANGDKHLNSIPLSEWDMRGIYTKGEISNSLKKRGEFWNQASSVCVHKAAAKDAALN
jgi:hypothetical protein